jgi:hypothetical protein
MKQTLNFEPLPAGRQHPKHVFFFKASPGQSHFRNAECVQQGRGFHQFYKFSFFLLEMPLQLHAPPHLMCCN